MLCCLQMILYSVEAFVSEEMCEKLTTPKHGSALTSMENP